MLKKIPIGDVRSGMFIHGFEGSWLSHPFWRNKFIIAEPDDLLRLRQSGLSGVWIDTDKGGDMVELDKDGIEGAPSYDGGNVPTIDRACGARV